MSERSGVLGFWGAEFHADWNPLLGAIAGGLEFAAVKK